MKVQVLSSQQIDPQQWDNFIERSREGNIYATYTYLEHCERAWKAAILQDDQGYFRAVLPFQVSKKWGIEYVYQDPFARELGIFTVEDLLPDHYQSLLQASLGSYRYVARYRFNVDNYCLVKQSNFFGKGGLSEKETYHLDLKLSYSSVWQAYHRDRRYSIKRAQRSEQRILQSDDLSPTMKIFSKVTLKRIPGLQPYQVELTEKLHEALHKRRLIEIYYVIYQREIIAGVIIAKFKQKIVYLLGTNSEIAFHLRSSSLLIDHVIQHHLSRENTFDFEGGDVPSLRSFYQSFGAERKVIWEYSKNELPFLLRWMMIIRRKIVQKLHRS